MFQLDSDIYNKNRQLQLSERLGAQNIASSQQDMAMNDQKMQQARIERAVQYLGMATPENWSALRQKAIAEGLGDDATIPPQYDENWISQTRMAFGDASSKMPSAVQEYNFYKRLGNPQAQEEYLKVKRADQVINLGGTQVVRNPLGGIKEEYTVTPKPDEMPQFKGEQARETAKGKTVGEAGANAAISLPDAIATAEMSLGLIDKMVGSADGTIKRHPGFSSAVGAKDVTSLFGLKDEPFAGTDAAGFKSIMKQLEGGAFLEAFKSLKGGGAITEIEGTKATQALMRMSTAQKEEEFLQAANEYKDIITRGIARAKAKAGAGGNTGSYTLPDGDTATDEDIRFTAQKYGISEDDARRQLGVK